MAWRCTWCGHRHEADDPPCENCGHDEFEESMEADEGGDGPRPVWVCPECGRDHTKHSPPCSRCGHVHLERRERDPAELDDEFGTDAGGTSYFDVLDWRYAVGFLAVFAFGSLLALGAAGVVDVPGVPSGPPAPPDAPGDAVEYRDVALDDVEAAYVDRLNERRVDAGLSPVVADERLGGAATTYNRRRVIADVEGDEPPSIRAAVAPYDPDCDGPLLPVFTRYRTVDGGLGDTSAGGEPTADVLGGALQSPSAPGEGVLDEGFQSIGVDVHVGPAPDEHLYVTVFLC